MIHVTAAKYAEMLHFIPPFGYGSTADSISVYFTLFFCENTLSHTCSCRALEGVLVVFIFEAIFFILRCR